MRKLLYLLFAITLIGCSDSDSNSDEYSSFSEELENNVYFEEGTTTFSNGEINKWEVYYTFDLSKYGYKSNGFTVEGDFRAECYSTFIYNRDGQIISDTDSSVTYSVGQTTLTFSRTKDGVRVQEQSKYCGSNCNWTWLKSDTSTLESLKVGKRSSNTCN
jgi:hypothetical protein